MNSSSISDPSAGSPRAVILAAGRGWRMRALSDTRHKALPDLIANYGSTQGILDQKLAYVLNRTNSSGDPR